MEREEFDELLREKLAYDEEMQKSFEKRQREEAEMGEIDYWEDR